MKTLDLTGQEFERLTVIERAGSDGRGEALWLCECTCGNRTTALSSNLRKSNGTKSCGCLKAEYGRKQFTTHGLSRAFDGKQSRLYEIWTGMKKRCSNPAHEFYHRYGGRGITVCADWQEFPPFHAWAMANGYADNLSIDRIENDGNYEPGNCQWITRADNTRKIAVDRRKRVVASCAS